MVVYVVSDSAGDTGEFAVRAAAAQFLPVVVDIRRVPFVQDTEAIDKVLANARRQNAMIAFTLVIPELRDYLLEQARLLLVETIDLLGPLLDSLERRVGRKSRREPGMNHMLDEDYFKKVEAVEFAVKYDDGRDVMGVLKADIVLVGVSRTSKTPLSMYLAHKKYKVANVPLVPELQPPSELFTIAKSKVVGLTINSAKLNEIRKERLKALGLAENANYAKIERIQRELEHANSIMERLGCTVIDVSNKAVEETASVILDMFRQRN